MAEHVDVRLSRKEYEAVFGALVLAAAAAEPYRRSDSPTPRTDEAQAFENAMVNAIHGFLGLPEMAGISLVMRMSRDGVAAFGESVSHAKVEGFTGRPALVTS